MEEKNLPSVVKTQHLLQSLGKTMAITQKILNQLATTPNYQALWDELPTHWRKIFLMNLYNYERIEKYFNKLRDYIDDTKKLYNNTPDDFIQSDDIYKLIKIEKLSVSYFEKITENEFDFPEIFKHFTNLKELNLWGSQITDISVLANLTNLEKLGLIQNQITDISVLKHLTNLEVLNLQNNRIADISVLANLTNLKELGLGGNQIKDISVLENLTNLKELKLSFNQIEDISPLKNLTNLERLYLYENQIQDISALANLTKLNLLSLSKNQIQDISVLGNLTNLKKLYLWENPISQTDIENLRKKLPNTNFYF